MVFLKIAVLVVLSIAAIAFIAVEEDDGNTSGWYFIFGCIFQAIVIATAWFWEV